jgi:hypothetical protein
MCVAKALQEIHYLFLRQFTIQTPEAMNTCFNRASTWNQVQIPMPLLGKIKKKFYADLFFVLAP